MNYINKKNINKDNFNNNSFILNIKSQKLDKEANVNNRYKRISSKSFIVDNDHSKNNKNSSKDERVINKIAIKEDKPIKIILNKSLINDNENPKIVYNNKNRNNNLSTIDDNYNNVNRNYKRSKSNLKLFKVKNSNGATFKTPFDSNCNLDSQHSKSFMNLNETVELDSDLLIKSNLDKEKRNDDFNKLNHSGKFSFKDTFSKYKESFSEFLPNYKFEED